MVLSYYIYKYPYVIAWYLAKIFGEQKDVVFYCADPLDCEMFAPIQKHLPPIKIVAKNKKTRDYLESKGASYFRMPVFPKAVIMARLAAHKFPCEKITKIGFGHGPYQFKEWSENRNFNAFDIYFLTSETHVKKARERGIVSVKAIGYPKLDPAFDGTYNEEFLQKLKDKIGLNTEKKTLFFSSTWGPGKLSALDKWIDEVGELASDYNILVSVHTWTQEDSKNKLRRTRGVYFIEEFNALPFLMIADVLVADYSSIIAEAIALDKPIITFVVPCEKRSREEIFEILEKVGLRVNNFYELREAIKIAVNNPEIKASEREKAKEIFFSYLDGKAGKRAAEEILKRVDFSSK